MNSSFRENGQPYHLPLFLKCGRSDLVLVNISIHTPKGQIPLPKWMFLYVVENSRGEIPLAQLGGIDRVEEMSVGRKYIEVVLCL